MSDTGPDAVATTTDPVALHDLALQLARGAAVIVREGRARGLSVAAKSSVTDLVTDVDRASESWLLAQLASRRPGDSVLGEESGDHSPDGGPAGVRVRWLLDPVDGTVNFVLGLPQYAVSVAAEVDGTVVAGAVCNPATGETFHARLGGGAFLGEQRLRGPRDVPLERAVVATGFAYDAATRGRQAAVVAQLLPAIADVRRLGAAALDLCFLAAGRLDGYFEAGLHPWDYGAGALIAAEAGAVVGDADGGPVSPRFVAASGPSLFGPLTALLRERGAPSVLNSAPARSG